MCQSAHLSHISPTYSPPRLRKNPISRNVRIVGSAVVTSWQAVRSNNKASAPVSSWLHQLRDTRLWINDTHSSPASCSRFMSLQTFNTDKQLICLKHHIHKKQCLISTPSDHAASNLICICLDVTRDMMNDLTPNKSFNETPVSSPA